MISELLLEKKETDIVDFKRTFYNNDKKYDFIKDLVAFANSNINGDKYIVFGVEDGTFKICEEVKITDISNWQQLINEYVDPTIPFEINYEICENKNISYITIKRKNTDMPYVIKKDYSSNGKTFLRKGEIYIRKGATNFIASRNDINDIYANKNDISLYLLDTHNETINLKQFLVFSVILNNNSYDSIDFKKLNCQIIINGNIIDLDKCIATSRKITDKNKYVISSDNPIKINHLNSLLLFLNFELDKKTLELLKKENIIYILKLTTNTNFTYSFNLKNNKE